jgi:hypothetical protein
VFEAAVAAISSLDGAFLTLLRAAAGSKPATAAGTSSQAQCFDVIAAALSTVTAAMSSAGTSAPLPLQGHALIVHAARDRLSDADLLPCEQ